MRALVLLAALAVPACPAPPTPQPSPPEPLDAAPSPTVSGCFAACATLKALDCAEGLASNCTSTCIHTQGSHQTDLHLMCLAAAKTKDAARRCGSVACL